MKEKIFIAVGLLFMLGILLFVAIEMWTPVVKWMANR